MWNGKSGFGKILLKSLEYLDLLFFQSILELLQHLFDKGMDRVGFPRRGADFDKIEKTVHDPIDLPDVLSDYSAIRLCGILTVEILSRKLDGILNRFQRPLDLVD